MTLERNFCYCKRTIERVPFKIDSFIFRPKFWLLFTGFISAVYPTEPD